MKVENKYLPDNIEISQEGLIAVEAALAAGKAIRASVGGKVVVKDGMSNVVNEADIASGQAIRRVVTQRITQFHILSEEGDETIEDPLKFSRLWIVDELDGSKNFADGIDNTWVSIAYAEFGVPKVGVCYNPISDRLYYAEKNNGAYYIGKAYGNKRWIKRKLSIANQTDLSKATIESSISYDKDQTLNHQIIKLSLLLEDFTPRFREIGSSVEQLCRVAAGISDLHFHSNLKPWDYAAGQLMIEEAGGVIKRLDGSEFNFMYPDSVAGNENLVNKFIDVIEKIKGNQNLVAKFRERLNRL